MTTREKQAILKNLTSNDWKEISLSIKLKDDFIDEFKLSVDFGYLSHSGNVSEYILVKYFPYLIPDVIFMKQKFRGDFILKNGGLFTKYIDYLLLYQDLDGKSKKLLQMMSELVK
jgi:hypothetical protein